MTEENTKVAAPDLSKLDAQGEDGVVTEAQQEDTSLEQRKQPDTWDSHAGGPIPPESKTNDNVARLEQGDASGTSVLEFSVDKPPERTYPDEFNASTDELSNKKVMDEIMKGEWEETTQDENPSDTQVETRIEEKMLSFPVEEKTDREKPQLTPVDEPTEVSSRTTQQTKDSLSTVPGKLENIEKKHETSPVEEFHLNREVSDAIDRSEMNGPEEEEKVLLDTSRDVKGREMYGVNDQSDDSKKEQNDSEMIEEVLASESSGIHGGECNTGDLETSGNEDANATKATKETEGHESRVENEKDTEAVVHSVNKNEIADTETVLPSTETSGTREDETTLGDEETNPVSFVEDSHLRESLIGLAENTAGVAREFTSSKETEPSKRCDPVEAVDRELESESGVMETASRQKVTMNEAAAGETSENHSKDAIVDDERPVERAREEDAETDLEETKKSVTLDRQAENSPAEVPVELAPENVMKPTVVEKIKGNATNGKEDNPCPIKKSVEPESEGVTPIEVSGNKDLDIQADTDPAILDSTKLETHYEKDAIAEAEIDPSESLGKLDHHDGSPKQTATIGVIKDVVSQGSSSEPDPSAETSTKPEAEDMALEGTVDARETEVTVAKESMLDEDGTNLEVGVTTNSTSESEGTHASEDIGHHLENATKFAKETELIVENLENEETEYVKPGSSLANAASSKATAEGTDAGDLDTVHPETPSQSVVALGKKVDRTEEGHLNAEGQKSAAGEDQVAEPEKVVVETERTDDATGTVFNKNKPSGEEGTTIPLDGKAKEEESPVVSKGKSSFANKIPQEHKVKDVVSLQMQPVSGEKITENTARDVIGLDTNARTGYTEKLPFDESESEMSLPFDEVKSPAHSKKVAIPPAFSSPTPSKTAERPTSPLSEQKGKLAIPTAFSKDKDVNEHVATTPANSPVPSKQKKVAIPPAFSSPSRSPGTVSSMHTSPDTKGAGKVAIPTVFSSKKAEILDVSPRRSPTGKKVAIPAAFKGTSSPKPSVKLDKVRVTAPVLSMEDSKGPNLKVSKETTANGNEKFHSPSLDSSEDVILTATENAVETHITRPFDEPPTSPEGSLLKNRQTETPKLATEPTSVPAGENTRETREKENETDAALSPSSSSAPILTNESAASDDVVADRSIPMEPTPSSSALQDQAACCIVM